MRHALAVVIATICRDSLIRAVRSIYTQKFSGKMQILIGVDCDPDNRAATLKSILEAECPENISLLWLDPGYSTSRRHGGLHSSVYGGSLRSALTLLADSEFVMYLDDDDWLTADHCASIMAAIEGKKWAFAYSIYADGNLGKALCVDELESVGIGKGVFAKRFGGFVRPSGMVINKMQTLPIIHLWACSPFPTGDGEDRLIFDQLRKEPCGCTNKATVYYTLDPRDAMHPQRLAFMRSKGVEFSSTSKMGSVRLAEQQTNRSISAGTGQSPEIIRSAASLLQQGKSAEAESLCHDILKETPGDFNALHLLGVIRAQCGAFEKAVELIGQALQAQPDHAEAKQNYRLAIAKLNKERLQSAQTYCREQQPEQAESLCQTILQLDPDNVDALQLLGSIAGSRKNLDQAEQLLQKALRLRPDYAQAHNNLGNVLKELQRLDEAVASYDRALALRPDFAEAHLNRGIALKAMKQLDEAIASYNRALVLRPDFAQAHLNRGTALKAMNRLDEAIESYDRSLVLRPDYAEAHLNRGTVLKAMDRLDEALISYDRALALKPDFAEAHYNRGTALHEKGRYQEALSSNAEALRLKPEYAKAHWNNSLCRLLLGDFATGWQEYEWRWQRGDDQESPRNFTQPLWLGHEDIKGKRILLHAEQGLGDTIQFCRYVPRVAALGATVILEGPRALAPLLRDLTGVSEFITRGSKLPAFDLHCPLLSLPLAFKADFGNISGKPYLHSPAAKVAEWASRLGAKKCARIGIVWSGSTGHSNDRNRSIPFAAFVQALPAGFDYVSLQKETRPADRDALSQAQGIRRFDAELKDFSDTAALIELMDLVISVDTSVAHLAGAMGKDVWILLPCVPDWRWLLDRPDSPWYASARLFRQAQRGQWANVLAEINQGLKART
jgi:tetratricopeptide (TPR) repeat protein